MSWRINSIRIKNFKFFKDEFPLKVDGKHLLLYGENGRGKGSIYWSFYTHYRGNRILGGMTYLLLFCCLALVLVVLAIIATTSFNMHFFIMSSQYFSRYPRTGFSIRQGVVMVL